MEKCKCGGSLWKHGGNRFKCKSCGKTCSEFEPKYSEADKNRAIKFYLNNCGIRKTALFIGCSPGTILNWIRERANNLNPETVSVDGDTIEMDEIWAQTDRRIAKKI
jgi:transposase-like protein